MAISIATEQDKMVKFDIAANGYDRTQRPGNWQVIFKTKNWHDYCRETMPESMSREAVKSWAEAQVIARRLGGAIIQKW